jgi:hypothetical protein
MSTATAYDFNVSQFRRTVNRKPSETPSTEAVFSIFDDLADGIEAIHQCANLAGFTERSRPFIIALATAAHSQSASCVELYDEALADLQNCSRRTVIRQREDYLRESRAKNFDFVEIIEGEFDKEAKRYKPTMYRFHLGDVVERIVAEARSSKDWHETDRRKQRDAILRAAANVYEEIPEAPTKRRKKKQPRPVMSEIETCQKVIRTKFGSLKDKASKLPPGERERLMNAVEPGELHGWWLQLRAEMDGFFNVDSPQLVTENDLAGVCDNLSHTPPVTVDTEEAAPPASDDAGHVTVKALKNEYTHTAEDFAVFEDFDKRLTAPQIRRVEVELPTLEPIPPLYADTPAFDEAILETAEMEVADDEPEFELELDPVEQAKERQRFHGQTAPGKKRTLPPNLAEVFKGETRDELATIAGVAHGTIQKAKHTIDLEYHADEAEPVAAFEVGALVVPVASDGAKLHTEPSPVAECRLTANGWQYRLDGFTQWRDERLYKLHMQYVE